MPQRRALLATTSGLHARPAALFTQRVADGGHLVQIAREGEAGVDASSILMVMGLRLQHGETVELTCDAPDCVPLLDELAELLGTDLDLVEQA
jgi:phosphocarrier protein